MLLCRKINSPGDLLLRWQRMLTDFVILTGKRGKWVELRGPGVYPVLRITIIGSNSLGSDLKSGLSRKNF